MLFEIILRGTWRTIDGRVGRKKEMCLRWRMNDGKDDLKAKDFPSQVMFDLPSIKVKWRIHVECATGNQSQVMLLVAWLWCFVTWLWSFHPLTCINSAWLAWNQLFEKIHMNHHNFLWREHNIMYIQTIIFKYKFYTKSRIMEIKTRWNVQFRSQLVRGPLKTSCH